MIELSKAEYDLCGKEFGLDKVLWIPFDLRWKISGPDNDELDIAGNIKTPGIINTNNRTIDLKAEKYPNLMYIIKDFKKYSL